MSSTAIGRYSTRRCTDAALMVRILRVSHCRYDKNRILLSGQHCSGGGGVKGDSRWLTHKGNGRGGLMVVIMGWWVWKRNGIFFWEDWRWGFRSSSWIWWMLNWDDVIGFLHSMSCMFQGTNVFYKGWMHLQGMNVFYERWMHLQGMNAFYMVWAYIKRYEWILHSVNTIVKSWMHITRYKRVEWIFLW